MDVDHFDPRRKREVMQDYANLFLATRHCNGVKLDSWPTPKEEAAGLRFLNCCKEQDYDAVIFEDPASHLLVGTTTAARYHIEILDLNHPTFVTERRDRTELARILNETPVRLPGQHVIDQVSDLIDYVKASILEMIPPIKSPPSSRRKAPSTGPSANLPSSHD